MYKKVLYNNKKMKKFGGGGGAIFEYKTLFMYLEKKRKRITKVIKTSFRILIV